MRKQYSQITFEFQDPPDSGQDTGVGVRIKTLKKNPADQELSVPQPSDDRGKVADISEESVNEDRAQNDQANVDQVNVDQSIVDDGVNDNPGLPEITSQYEEALDLQGDDRLTDVFDSGETSLETTVLQIEQDEPAVVPKSVKSTRGRKSLKTIDEGTELINIPPDEELFKKQYYAIGEVAEMFHVNQSLLRFWETEFDIIQPRKNRKGDRHFRPIDIKNLLLIHDLLRRRKLTIEGAKDFLKKNKRSPERFAMIQSLQKIRGFILEVKATL